MVSGLALAPVLVNPAFFVCGLVLVFVAGCRVRVPCRSAVLFCAIGVLLSLRLQTQIATEHRAFGSFDPEVFVTVEVPLDRDWAERDHSFVLRASSFTANGIAFDTPISIYARFTPPEIAMEATLRAEGFLRFNERGEYTLGLKSRELMSYAGSLPRWHPRTWNRILANRLEAHARNSPNEVALAQALLLGRGERLTDEMRESFRRGGTYHLLVFSGLQIAFAAALLAALLRWMHAPRVSDWLLLSFAALAPLFIGPTASVSRASVGIALYALSRILRRPTSLENLWCFAALLRLAIEPRDLTDPSFHLTYAGAGALLFIGKHLVERKWLAHAVAAEIAIAPLTLFHFHQYALGGALLTLVMAPLIFAMLVASLLACALAPALYVIRALHALCASLNAFGFAGWLAAPPLAILIASALAALLAIAALRSRARAVAVALLLLVPSLSAVMRSIRAANVAHPQITFFDIGQGDAIAVRSGKETMLVDGGRDSRLLPLLADAGIRRVDAVALTHAHPDHCAALPEVIESFGVRRVLITARKFHGDCATKILAACSRSRVPIQIVRDGEAVRLGEFALTAHLADRTFRRAPENNASLIFMARARGRSVLLTGDAEKEAEYTLADRDLRADVLKVAHHGSRSSTSETWLDVVQPRVAVISCGRHNLFGHPHPEVLDALGARGIRTWRTDRDGSVEVELREGQVYVRGGNH